MAAKKPFIRGGVEYPSQYAYRKALAERGGFSSKDVRALYVKAERELARLTRPQQEARRKALRVLSEARETGKPLGRLARERGTTLKSVLKYAGAGVTRVGRKLTVKGEDTLTRRMAVPSPDGVSKEIITSSRDASLLGKYWNAVRRYKETGDLSSLDNFRGKTITVRGRQVELVTDKEELDMLVRSGELTTKEDITETSP